MFILVYAEAKSDIEGRAKRMDVEDVHPWLRLRKLTVTSPCTLPTMLRSDSLISAIVEHPVSVSPDMRVFPYCITVTKIVSEGCNGNSVLWGDRRVAVLVDAGLWTKVFIRESVL